MNEKKILAVKRLRSIVRVACARHDATLVGHKTRILAYWHDWNRSFGDDVRKFELKLGGEIAKRKNAWNEILMILNLSGVNEKFDVYHGISYTTVVIPVLIR